MTFAYRIRFHFCKGNTVESDQARVEFPIDDTNFTLKALTENALKKSNMMVLCCGGFNSDTEAAAQGKKLQNSLSLCGAILQRGIDVGKDKNVSTAGQPLKETFKKYGAQLLNDIHGLTVYRDDIKTSVITAHGASITTSFHPDVFISAVKKAYYLSPEFTGKEKIAFDLYNSSFFEATRIARFLTLVSVVETLSFTERMDEDVIKLIDELIIYSKQSNLEQPKKNIVINRIGNLKKQSISASSKQIIRKYMSAHDSKTFSDFYNIRSGLLHDGVLRCEENEFNQKLNQLNSMVSQLLLKIMESKAPN